MDPRIRNLGVHDLLRRAPVAARDRLHPGDACSSSPTSAAPSSGIPCACSWAGRHPAGPTDCASPCACCGSWSGAASCSCRPSGAAVGGRRGRLQLDRRTAPQAAVLEPLAALEPLQLQAVTAPREAQLWNHWVQRYHPLGYRQPIGTHLRYYVLDGRGRTLGCLLFDFATKSLPCRDRWIGWEGQAFRKRLHLVVRNSRYLLFPWVEVSNLASKVLGLAARQLPRDWQRLHGYRPVLAETFVNPAPAPGELLPGGELAAGRSHGGTRGAGQGPGEAAQGRLRPTAAPRAGGRSCCGARRPPPSGGRRGRHRRTTALCACGRTSSTAWCGRRPRTTATGSADGGRSAPCWWCCSSTAWPIPRNRGATP